jgi:hypothetical protein
LFVDLRGFSPTGEPMPPAVAVRGFLDAFGVDPGRMPTDLDAQAALYRSLVADKRILVVLDNAATIDQIEPLLPGSTTCAVLVTSRKILTTLITRSTQPPLDLRVFDGVSNWPRSSQNDNPFMKSGGVMYHKPVVKKSNWTSRNAWIVVAIVTGALFAMSGCAGWADQRPAPTPDSSTHQQTSNTSPTNASSMPVAPSISVASSSARAVAQPDFPPAVAPSALQHGGTYWGVYVSVVRADDKLQIKPDDQKRLDSAAKSLTDLGYKPDAGAFDVGCEQGMREQLRLDAQRNYAAVRIFFAEQSQAQRFVTAYQPGIVGTAKVTLYCMD